MRKIEYCNVGFFGGPGNNAASDIQTGHFHGFFSEGNSAEGIQTFALVEKEDGTVSCVPTHKVRFFSPIAATRMKPWDQ